MASGFYIEGAQDFGRLARALRDGAEKDLQREMRKGIRDAAKPLVKALKDAARSDLPKGGGLNNFVAGSTVSVRYRTGARFPGVDIAFAKRQPGYLDGSIRHPVFARTERVQSDKSKRKDGTIAKKVSIHGKTRVKWVEQKVDGDWFDGTVAESGPLVRPEIMAAIDAVIEKVARSSV